LVSAPVSARICVSEYGPVSITENAPTRPFLPSLMQETLLEPGVIAQVQPGRRMVEPARGLRAHWASSTGAARAPVAQLVGRPTNTVHVDPATVMCGLCSTHEECGPWSWLHTDMGGEAADAAGAAVSARPPSTAAASGVRMRIEAPRRGRTRTYAVPR